MMQLLDLPRELLVAVLEIAAIELDAEEFGNLRLLCREIRSITFAAFQRRFFNTRHHMLQPNSLQNLVEISKDPQFGPAVHTLQISMDHLRDELFFIFALSPPEEPGDVDRTEYGRVMQEQKNMKNVGLDLAYLTSALGRLTNCKAVSVCDVGQPWGAASITKKVRRDLFRSIESPESNAFGARAFRILFAAIVASDLRLETFHVTLGRGGDPIVPNILVFPEHFSQQLRHCLTSLTTVTLAFNTDIKVGKTVADWIRDFVFSLEPFSNIKHFALDLIVDYGDPSLHDIISERLRLPHLQTLKLSGGKCTIDDIRLYVANHQSTLQEIYLDSKMLTEEVSDGSTIDEMSEESISGEISDESISGEISEESLSRAIRDEFGIVPIVHYFRAPKNISRFLDTNRRGIGGVRQW